MKILFLIFLLLLPPIPAKADIIKPGDFLGVPRTHEICATSYDQFQLTKRLRSLALYFEPDGVTGYLNQTGGSYFEIDTRKSESSEHGITITFITSGLFDLSLIKRSGPMTFCDDGSSLVAKGIGRLDKIDLQNGVITFGRGGSTLTFQRGEKPDLLRKLEKN